MSTQAPMDVAKTLHILSVEKGIPLSMISMQVGIPEMTLRSWLTRARNPRPTSRIYRTLPAFYERVRLGKWRLSDQ